MSAEADPVVSAAIAERDHAARLLEEHQASCRCRAVHLADCDECASLAWHAERTARQAELLAPDAETGEMF